MSQENILAKASSQEQGPSGTMDVTGSMRKIGRELLELKQDQPDLLDRLEAASWLITYIADALDVELNHAAERGRRLALGLGDGDINKPVRYELNSQGTRIYDTISGEDF